VSPGGFSGPVEKADYQLEDARRLARRYLVEIGRARGLSAYADEALVYMEEQFNVIRGSHLAGKIFDLGIQIAPGFIHGYKGVAR
jgi:hypothetical protein